MVSAFQYLRGKHSTFPAHYPMENLSCQKPFHNPYIDFSFYRLRYLALGKHPSHHINTNIVNPQTTSTLYRTNTLPPTMLRQTLTTTSARLHSISLPVGQRFSTASRLQCKARVGQMLEQAQAALSATAAKEVNTNEGQNDNSVCRNQLIWLVKHSLGENPAAKILTPHEESWNTGPLQRKDGQGGSGSESQRGVVTVWSHLWSVLLSVSCRTCVLTCRIGELGLIHCARLSKEACPWRYFLSQAKLTMIMNDT
ncbi:hypothetical protein CC80DRAFT_123842 [Byssothecium circinans]|uniref:Uncharacterized protein n=1 Tax=Byssothecium circinans TaxID=147558 RepID=A0A6A5TVE9_9PLEO|nr:hypothetical protein CC80DRAFT_123842 [Byssothecium circinans]